MLEVKDLSLHYGQSQILYDVSLRAETGQITCLMGMNGVGKTSLLKALAGVHPRSEGEVTLDGDSLGRLHAHALAKRGIAYVPQGREIFPLLTVQENLETGFNCISDGARMVPDEIFELFPVLKEMRGRRGGDLSGGQQQQLAIGRALVTGPSLLLLDEPTEGIQPNIIQQIGRVIEHLRDRKTMAIILVEQYFDFAFGLADRFYAMRRGQIMLSGSKGEVSREALLEAVSV
ncbi:urea ABC transporter ATP-binding subunit UrtE [Actibacterium ureilyticum]|uniref:urea ABC transporter ATP-binding subunit UrtE n=1 Tax=Actibacterium ureilyticum TaxID=1590614 RepID=UPI000BAADCFC|nr:urea ABC transporter ATP-binding subunit UrtE [Actibacterium ureilyticum]